MQLKIAINHNEKLEFSCCQQLSGTLKAKELESLIPVVNDEMGKEASLHEGWDWEEIREIPKAMSEVKVGYWLGGKTATP